MSGPLTDVRGAIYFPSKVLNHYQTWSQFDRSEVHRDLTYAAELNLNALRVIVGYEFWRDNPNEFRDAFDSFMSLADAHDIQILPVFFESIGDKPIPKNLTDTDLLTSFAVKSPSSKVISNRSRWNGPRSFVQWFVNRYANHNALLAVEIMNEPGEWKPRVNFCRAMLRAARDINPDVPLTMGSKEFKYNRQYTDPELDIYQFHFNLPPHADDMRETLREAKAVADDTKKPIWLTEWQRTREGPPNKMLPNYESLANIIRNSDIHGDFFWQLMLKPAYINKPRKQGRLNGLFHPDGTVYSTGDAQALANHDDFTEERTDWPDWASNLPKRINYRKNAD